MRHSIALLLLNSTLVAGLTLSQDPGDDQGSPTVAPEFRGVAIAISETRNSIYRLHGTIQLDREAVDSLGAPPLDAVVVIVGSQLYATAWRLLDETGAVGARDSSAAAMPYRAYFHADLCRKLIADPGRTHYITVSVGRHLSNTVTLKVEKGLCEPSP